MYSDICSCVSGVLFINVRDRFAKKSFITDELSGEVKTFAGLCREDLTIFFFTFSYHRFNFRLKLYFPCYILNYRGK